MRLAFSTLSCPAWTWDQTIENAVRWGYDGLEWRLVDGQIIGREFPRDRAAEIGRASADAGLTVLALDSSIDLAAQPGPERDRVLAETRTMLDTAGRFGAEFLRVFPGAFPPAAGAATWLRETIELLRRDCRDAGVRIALELHDSRDQPGIRGISCSRFLAEALEGTDIPEVRVQWDIGNPHLEGEPAAETWANIGRWLSYLHLKDMVRTTGGWRYTPMGEGELPLRDILRWIGGRQFDGWSSFEWEKYWHPELAEPEVVLPGFVAYMSEYR